LVDAVLSLRALERRELFEEAAGIAHYRDKRADALRRLDETQHNLERVHDIISEIEPRLQRLKRQADRTREHEKLSSHLKQSLRIWYGYRWGQDTATLERAQQIARQRSDQQEERSKSLQEVTTEIDEIREAESTLRRLLGDWHKQSSLLHAQVEEAQRELAILSERGQHLVEQRLDHLAEITILDARRDAQSTRVGQARTEADAARRALSQSEEKALEAQAAAESRRLQLNALTETRNAIREQLAALHASITEKESLQKDLIERTAALENQDRGNRSQVVQLDAELGRWSSQISRVEKKATQIDRELYQSRSNLGAVEDQQRALTETLDQQQSRLHRIRETEAEVSAQLELLDQLRHDFVIYGEASRALLTAQDGFARIRPGLKGVLAQLIQVSAEPSPRVALAVEAALGIYAGAIIVADWQTAEMALDILQSTNVAGRVTLLALKSSPLGQQPVLRSQGASLDRPLSAFVQCDDELRPLVERLLGRAFLVPDLQAAREALTHLPTGALCVTPEGKVLRSDGIIEGGRPAEQTNPMVQEKEWSRLSANHIRIGAAREKLEARVTQTTVELGSIQTTIAEMSIAIDGLLARRTATSTLREKLIRQTDRLKHEIEWRESQIRNGESEASTLRLQRDELTREISMLTQAEIGAEARLRETRAAIESLPTEQLDEAFAAAQAAVAAARQIQQGQREILQELESTLNQLEQEIEGRRRRVAELKEGEQDVVKQSSQVSRIRADRTDRLDALTAQIEAAENRLTSLDREQRRLEARERLERARLREFDSHLTAARLEVQRREDRLAQLRSRIEEDLGLVELDSAASVSAQSPLPLHPLVSKLPVVQRLPEGAEEEVKRLRAQLRRLGAINPNAPEDYKEILERHSFLQEQSSDLAGAYESLRQIIAEMDGLIEHAFGQTFDTVAQEFSETFRTLFGGGKARLELTNPDDLSQTGIEIVAQPPGKRLQALASLSGGERALTAVALIFSILKVSPTPFCILDEVDAMLDEANIGRFRTLLQRLTNHTQFVIITHNRGTISAADTVYGISMGADSVSQVYSIQIEGEKLKQV
jgi:chromosome segregation protein